MKLIVNEIELDEVNFVNENFYPIKELSVVFDSNVNYNESFEKLETDSILNKIVIVMDNSTEIDFSGKFNKVDRIVKKIAESKRTPESIQIVFIKED